MKINLLTIASGNRWQLPACEMVLKLIPNLIRTADRRKIIMRANLSLLIIFIAFMQASSAESYGQKITINKKNASLKSIFHAIKQQTGYLIIYNSDDLINATVDVNVNQADVEEVMNKCLKDLPFTFKIVKRNILVRRTDDKILPEDKPMSSGQRIIVAMQSEVRGSVVDEKGGPLVGVSIKVKGTKQGTVTDSNGSFRLSLDDKDATLLFSFIGYTTQEILLKGRSQLSVVMLEDNSKLNEVVVVGYGTQKKINMTAAIDVVSGEQLENRPAPNVALLLQGLSPNLNISLNSFGGEPGAVQSFQIRGVGSVQSTAKPLILVDGVEADVNFLDPQTIESVSILKDASAGAVYGSRAAFGVVLITTKRGTKYQTTRVEYSNNTSFSAPIYVPSMESSLVYATAFNQAAANAGITPVFPAEQVERIKGYINGTYKDEYNRARPPVSQWRGRWDGNANYNWTKEYYKKYALHQKHNVSLNGGGEKSQYYVNAGLFDQPGAYSWGDDGYKRYNLLANLTTQVNDWISFNFSSKYARNKTDVPLGVVSYPRTYTWSQFTNFWPTMPKYTVDGAISNPIILVLENGGRIVTENHDLWMNIGAELEPIKGWKTNISYKYNYQWGVGSRNPKPVPVPVPNGTTGNIGEPSSGYSSNTDLYEYNLISLFSSYEKLLGKHFIKGLVGYERDSRYSQGLNGSKMNLITEAVPSIRTALGDFSVADYKSHSATEGVFGRLNYNFDEKYLFEFSARYNGSSKFAPHLRWGFFPSFAAGYNVSKEKFWKNVEPYVNTLKLRGSFGALGNQEIDNYAYLPTMSIAYRRGTGDYSNPGYLINNEVPLYALMPQIVSDKLTWETITTLDFGLEAGIFKNRLNIMFDWYNRVTSDMIGPTVQRPIVLGAGGPFENNAKLSTKGFELSMAWQDRISSNLSYNAKLTLGNSKTTILEYLNESGYIAGWYKGKVHGDVWGLTTDRIIQSPGEAMPDQSLYYAKWGPGDIVYKDLDNNGVINQGTQTLDNHGDLSIIANTRPRYNYGITAGFIWKSLDFNMFWQGILKRDFLPNNNAEYFWGIMGTPNSSAIFSGGKMLDYWRPANETNMFGPNTNAYFPKPYFNFEERSKNVQVQSKYILNAAYLRLKNVQIGYTVPPTLLKRLLIQRARFYVSVENLLTFSKLPKMYEPETTVASGEGSVDMGEIYPINQMFSLGVNLSF